MAAGGFPFNRLLRLATEQAEFLLLAASLLETGTGGKALPVALRRELLVALRDWTGDRASWALERATEKAERPPAAKWISEFMEKRAEILVKAAVEAKRPPKGARRHDGASVVDFPGPAP